VDARRSPDYPDDQWAPWTSARGQDGEGGLEAADELPDHVDGGAHVGADLVHVDRRLTGPIGGASRAEPAASSRAPPS